MGLDAVELIIRAEEFYVITIGDEEAAAVRTVGDFYRLICGKLNVYPLESPLTSDTLPAVSKKEWGFLFLQKRAPLPAPSEILPWTPQSIWDSLVAVVVDQLCLKPSEVFYHASFAEDLRVDRVAERPMLYSKLPAKPGAPYLAAPSPDVGRTTIMSWDSSEPKHHARKSNHLADYRGHRKTGSPPSQTHRTSCKPTSGDTAARYGAPGCRGNDVVS